MKNSLQLLTLLQHKHIQLTMSAAAAAALSAVLLPDCRNRN
jgi:hypothetical protein